ncbi:ankyrin repeat domain-containing protein 7-like [Centruroides vittatus]|uniref:ankyrin repeat domain-containing protein 7-like n=1 Tax=Centruroides vittatus TaxID=120091 RepID=UPI00350F04AE
MSSKFSFKISNAIGKKSEQRFNSKDSLKEVKAKNSFWARDFETIQRKSASTAKLSILSTIDSTLQAREQKRTKSSLLHMAISQGKKDIVSNLLSEDLDVNDQDAEGRTPLMNAVEYKQYDLLNYLIEQGAEVDHIDKNGNTALHIALDTGSYDMAHIILRQSPNVNVGRNDGLTPLHLAANLKQDKTIKKILRQGAIVDIRDEQMRTPLMLACKKGHLPSILLLLQRGANPALKDKHGWSAKDFASIMGHNKVIEMLNLYENPEQVGEEIHLEKNEIQWKEKRMENSNEAGDVKAALPKEVELSPHLLSKLENIVNKYTLQN